jgi:N-methylhydantoinase B
VLDAGEQLFVERLAAIPDGRWSHRAPIEAALPGDRNTYFYQVNITKLGDRLIVDNEGTDPQTGSINLTFAGFAGCVQAALTMQMLPEQAGAYGGAYRRVDFRLVPGLLNCADPPAAVSSSGAYSVMSNLNVAATAVCKMLASGNDETRDLILGAPTPNLSTLIGGGVLSDGEQFIIIESNGLMGSLAGRASRDGVDVGGEWWIPDALGLNSEDLEAQTPFVVLTRELLPVGTDGAGRFRSGVGFRETLAARGIQGAQMFVHSNESFPRGIGLFGGNPGSIATCRVKNATDLAAQFAAGRLPRILNELNGVEQVVDYKGAPIGLADFDVIEWTSPGAAGYGDPLLRDPALVLADFEARMIDHDAAARVYGVVLAGDSGAVRVDDVATSMARCTLLTKRLDGHEPGAQVQPPGGARRVGELLHVVDGRWWCNGADLGAEDEDYRRTALTRDTPTRQLGPEFDSVDGEMADRFVLREYLCPVTGYRIDTELIACPERARG